MRITIQKRLSLRPYQQHAAFHLQIHEVRYDKQNAYQSVAKVMDLKVGGHPSYTAHQLAFLCIQQSA
jgi:hypothetical protein